MNQLEVVQAKLEQYSSGLRRWSRSLEKVFPHCKEKKRQITCVLRNNCKKSWISYWNKKIESGNKELRGIGWRKGGGNNFLSCMC